MNYISVVLILAGIVHLIPAKGVLGSDHIVDLYGIGAPNADLELLLRHRAILFALLGAFMLLAAFNKFYQPLAVVAGIISTSSFIVLSGFIGKPNGLIARVVLIDWVAAILLVVAGLILIYKSINNP